MRPSDVDRENECIQLLRTLHAREIVLIGGYAVSAVSLPRFSVDLDLVIQKKSLAGIRRALSARGWVRSTGPLHGLPYLSFERWERPGSRLPVAADLMIGGVSDRVTGITRSFAELFRDSTRMMVRGITGDLTAEATVASREVLIGLKLQVGRLADIRDIAVLALGNIDRARLKEFIRPIPPEILRARTSALIESLETAEFKDSLKGVFGMDETQFQRTRKAARTLAAWLATSGSTKT